MINNAPFVHGPGKRREVFASWRIWAFFYLILLSSPVAHALTKGHTVSRSQEMRLGALSISGTGCPEGSVRWEVDKSRSFLRLGFDEFFVEAGQGTNKLQDLRYCSISLPLQVPPHTKVAIIPKRVKGFAYLPAQCQGGVSVGVSYSGVKGAFSEGNLNGPYNDTFSFSGGSSRPKHWSECGKNVVVRLLISAKVQTPDLQRGAFVVMGDAGAAQEFELISAPCP